MNKRRALTPDEAEDIDRLRTIFERQKDEQGLTQAQLAETCGWESQGTVAQYFGKRIPLNIDAAFRLAKALNVPLDAISPRLAAKAVELFGATVAGRERPKTFEEVLTAHAPEIERLKLSDTGQRAIAGLIKAYENDPAAGDRLSRALLTLVGGE